MSSAERQARAQQSPVTLLAPGTRLGPYEIVSHMASGGMGDVYRGRDTRLQRLVAIKVVATAAHGADGGHERFEREMRAIASFSHPHICTVHDVGAIPAASEGVPSRPFLVMELLEGDTLASHIQTGPLSIPQALQYAAQILDALRHAHRAGFVHRDLKPQNIFVTASGIKLLDFGLTRAIVPEGLEDQNLTVTQLTAPHLILGTPAYMAPEQIEGRRIDGRTDVFAFGAVLYEMISGRAPFADESAARVFAAVLERPAAPLTDIRPDVPPLLARVIERCLEKKPEDRWQSAEDLDRELRWASQTPASVTRGARSWSGRVLAIITSLAIIAIAFIVAAVLPQRQAEPMVKAAVVLPDGLQPAGSNPIAIAPDGRRFACVLAADGRPSQLYLRNLDTDTLRALPGTEAAVEPFWAPDGSALGFFARDRLMRLDLATLATSVLADGATGGGGAWSADGTIVFARRFGAAALWKISPSGGTAKPFTQLGPRETNHLWPRFLPDGRHVLLHVLGREASDPSGVYVSDLSGGPLRPVMASPPPGEAGKPDSPLRAYAAAGKLIVLRGDVAFAQDFDARTLVLSGEPDRIVDRIARHVIGPAQFDVTDSLLVYGSPTDPPLRQLTWVDRTGQQLTIVGTAAPYSDLALSRDGEQLIAQYDDGVSRTLRSVDLRLGTSMPLALTTDDMGPVWSPDGRLFVFGSARRGPPALFARTFDDQSSERRLTPTGAVNIPTDWSMKPHIILYDRVDRQRDIWGVDPDQPETRHAILQTPFDEFGARLSPDGRWIAFVSNAAGAPELYVAPFPSVRPQLRISSNGGRRPRWRRDGKELFFVSGDGYLMSTAFNGLSTPGARPPVRLFPLRGEGNEYEIAPDGHRFLLTTTVRVPAPPPLTFVRNWSAMLDR